MHHPTPITPTPRTPAVSVELVPRSRDSLAAELSALGARFGALDTVNIPDLERLSLRSWDACALARPRFTCTIPHLRALDVDLADIDRLAERLASRQLDTVIVVRGDPPQTPGRMAHPTTSVELIAALRRALPRLRIHAALDPYRQAMRGELEGVRAKLDAGADGLFTQPFFDLRLMEVWADALSADSSADETQIHWGISPVTRAASRRYWETKNGVVFPHAYGLALEANQAFARDALAWAQQRGQGVYFMPIREDPVTYLEDVLDAEAFGATGSAFAGRTESRAQSG